jgi:inosine/xanthosine triphosphatase
MKIAIGTTSESKTAIVKAFFGDIKNFMIVPCDVSSGITDQPLDEFTTREGALNRAKNALDMTLETDINFSLGLEGGSC